MFICLVLTGNSTNTGGGKGVRKPPEVPNKKGERYDSINNGSGGHFIVYDNHKSYPGYLITFK